MAHIFREDNWKPSQIHIVVLTESHKNMPIRMFRIHSSPTQEHSCKLQSIGLRSAILQFVKPWRISPPALGRPMPISWPHRGYGALGFMEHSALACVLSIKAHRSKTFYNENREQAFLIGHVQVIHPCFLPFGTCNRLLCGLSETEAPCELNALWKSKPLPLHSFAARETYGKECLTFWVCHVSSRLICL